MHPPTYDTNPNANPYINGTQDNANWETNRVIAKRREEHYQNILRVEEANRQHQFEADKARGVREAEEQQKIEHTKRNQQDLKAKEIKQNRQKMPTPRVNPTRL